MSAQKLILDTDIGDDIDDVLALGLLLSSPEIEPVGVTTVFKNTLARTRQARSLLKIAGFENVPVAAGCGASISPQNDDEPQFNSLKAYLNDELPNQHITCLEEELLPELHDAHGVDFIIDTILAGDGDITIATIGPMTNVAMAIVKEPRIIAKIPKIVSMAGCFEKENVEWNVRSDPMAAEIVFKSGIPMDLVGLDVTEKVKLSEENLESLKQNDTLLCKKLFETIGTWQAYVKSIERNRPDAILPILHDPLTIAVMINPSLVEWKTGLVSVDLDRKKQFGRTLCNENLSDIHRYACNVNFQAVISMWMERVNCNKVCI